MLKSIVCTYPGFRELPKGLKQMLVTSESLFFDDAQKASWEMDDREPESGHLRKMSPKPSFTNRYHAFAA